MRPLSTRLSDESLKSGIARHIIEKDYVLSWVLAGISQIKELQKHLIFKGGTCLKKCYFGDYRFSEDLDFSAVGHYPSGQKLETLMQDATTKANELLSSYVDNAELICNKYEEKKPHPEGQEAFVIKARLPYQREHIVRVLVEVTVNEEVFSPIQQQRIIHTYGEDINSLINVYSLEEIVSEKVCAILGNAKKLHEKTWHRSRARDFYDLWRIFSQFGGRISKESLADTIQHKTKLKNLPLTSIDDLFQNDYVTEIKRTWKEWLGPLVPGLPSCNQVLDELRKIITDEWKESFLKTNKNHV